MRFTCIILYLFFNVVQVLSHANHFSVHTTYAFRSLLYCLVQYPYVLTLLVNYPNRPKTININSWRTIANFSNSYPKPILVVKTPNDFIFPFVKGLHWNLFFCKNGNNFWWKVLWVGSFYLLDGSFPIIPRNASWSIRTEATIICLNFCVSWLIFLGETDNQQTKSPNQVMFVYRQGLKGNTHEYCFYPWRTSGQEFSTYHVIRQRS